MNLLWVAAQLGICVEALGAGLGVYFAWQAKRQWQNVMMFGDESFTFGQGPHPRDEFVAGFRRQMWAFGLIAAGLVLQFVGNFAK